jgi:hypothetical protein
MMLSHQLFQNYKKSQMFYWKNKSKIPPSTLDILVPLSNYINAPKSRVKKSQEELI